jgi:type IV secretion system protein VirB9
MKKLPISLIITTLFAINAYAAIPAYEVAIPQTQIRSVVANNRTPISIDVQRGNPLLIEFEGQEVVDDIALGGVGDWRTSWEIVKRGTRLFVKLIGSKEPERSLIITTSLHSYVFYLVPHDTNKGLAFVSKLSVSFEKDAPIPNIKNLSMALPLVPAVTLPKQPVVSKRNYSYTMQVVSESVDIRPRATWDDGRFTYMLFPNNIPTPAIYRTVPGSDEEALVNWHIDGDITVLHGISPAWNLRMGKSVLGIFNEKFNAVGIATPNKTTTTDIREDK